MINGVPHDYGNPNLKNMGQLGRCPFLSISEKPFSSHLLLGQSSTSGTSPSYIQKSPFTAFTAQLFDVYSPIPTHYRPILSIL
jgi:hypothetical protein